MTTSSSSEDSSSQSSACSAGGGSFAAAASFFALRIRACSKSETTLGCPQEPQSQSGACFAGGSVAVDEDASLAAISEIGPRARRLIQGERSPSFPSVSERPILELYSSAATMVWRIVTRVPNAALPLPTDPL